MPNSEFPAAAIPGAAMRFPSGEYVTLPNVPVFREHKTRAVDGRQLEFGMGQLKAVCDRCNRRIAETGDYAAVVIGHTPDPSQADAPQPELVGYAGPFRLGTIGAGERKCWAILADFHIFRNDLAKVRKHPRRSPELCLEDTYEEMFLDPIALLGAEAPRLDLGLMTGAQPAEPQQADAEQTARHLYSFVRDGRRKEKYAMATCAAPSASNVFAPQKTSITDKPQKYAANPTPAPAKATTMLTPEDISAVVEAFLSTDAGQFLVQEMREKQGTNAIVEPTQEPPADEIQPPEAMGESNPGLPPQAPSAAPPAAAPTEPMPDTAPPAGGRRGARPAAGPPQGRPPRPPMSLPEAHGEPDGDEKAKKYAAACKSADTLEDKDLEKYLSQRWKNSAKWKKYCAASIEGDDKTPEGDLVQETGDPQGSGAAPPAKQLKPTQRYSRLQSELQGMKGQLAAEQAARKSVERYSRLQGLSAEFIMDPDEEMANIAEMNDAQFQRHVDNTIREHYQRNPVGLPGLCPPTPRAPTATPATPATRPRKRPRRTWTRPWRSTSGSGWPARPPTSPSASKRSRPASDTGRDWGLEISDSKNRNPSLPPIPNPLSPQPLSDQESIQWKAPTSSLAAISTRAASWFWIAPPTTPAARPAALWPWPQSRRRRRGLQRLRGDRHQPARHRLPAAERHARHRRQLRRGGRRLTYRRPRPIRLRGAVHRRSPPAKRSSPPAPAAATPPPARGADRRVQLGHAAAVRRHRPAERSGRRELALVFVQPGIF